MKSFGVLGFLAMWAALLTTAPGLAQSDERGRLHFQAGASYYEAGDYEDALREFARAQELSGKPELFYNISLCHQQLGDLEQAIVSLEAYLGNVEEIENRTNLERRLENFRERLAEEAAGGGEEITPAVQDPEPSSGPNVGAIVGLGVAGVGLVTLVVSGTMALSEKSALEDRGCGSTIECDAGTLRTRSLVADIGLGLTVAGATLGMVLWLLGRDDESEDAAAVSVAPWAGPQGAGASVMGRF